MQTHNTLIARLLPTQSTRLLTTLVAIATCHLALPLAALRAADADLPSRLPGLVATLSRGQAAGEPAQRVDLVMQHVWKRPGELDERLADDVTVDVTWRGALAAASEGTYQLHLFVAGKATLVLDGNEVATGESTQGAWVASSPLELDFGAHELELHYQGAGPGGQIGLYWQGPGFQLEPISDRYLTHASAETPPDDYQRGRLLAHALRCAACHESSLVPKALPAPDLTRLEGNLDHDWLQHWLAERKPADPVPDEVVANDPIMDDQIDRRMPHFGLNLQQAADIALALTTDSLPSEPGNQAATERHRTDVGSPIKSPADKQPARTQPDAIEGKKVFDTRGCLACHSMLERQLGQVDPDNDSTYLPERRFDRLTQELFDGGDLSAIASKRPAEFFERWLADPGRVNAHHRMPTTALDPLERADVALYLASLKGPASLEDTDAEQTDEPAELNWPRGEAERGRELLVAFRCGACHKLPASIGNSPRIAKPLSRHSRWEAGCLEEPDALQRRPGFQLSAGQRRALQVYWSETQLTEAVRTAQAPASNEQPTAPDTPADLLLAQKNCTACHARGSRQGIAARNAQLVAVEGGLASLLPALQPPSLLGVGDKLHEEALRAAIDQTAPSRRPWLEVRMPKYALPAAEREKLIAHFIGQDRIPERDSRHESLADDVVTRAAAGRLVTSEGFGCQSCHQIGKQPPPAVALNARGTDLTMLGGRIRRAWFDRWVRNPVRIVPRMEMPAIQVPVRGVLGDNLDRQIDSVWEMLNTEGFQPPAPAPVRIVRGHNLPGQPEPARVLTDILETPSRVYLRPLVVGLGNRHNILFDLQTAEFGQWWIGDTARELTRGKSWYWEQGGQPLSQKLTALAKLGLKDSADQTWTAKPLEQFAVEFDALSHTRVGVVWKGRITFVHQSQQRVVPIELSIAPLASATEGASGIAAVLSADLPGDFSLTIELDPLGGQLQAHSNHGAPDSWSAAIDERSEMSLRPIRGSLVQAGEHELQISAVAAGKGLQLAIDWKTNWPVDSFVDMDARRPSASAEATDSAGTVPPAAASPSEPAEPIRLDVVPGFRALQLPLPRTEMPTGFAWYRGALIASSLKGRVLRALDRDGDGLAETWEPLSDDLPAPYGVAASEAGIDVVAKYGVLRLTEPSESNGGDTASSGQPWPMQMIADGWGYTADYHDWAVGLVPDGKGNYFVALPCQQDDRSPSAARLRGTVQKLIPQSPTSEQPRFFRLETYCAGQRFPMGLALNAQGDLFATDNQGNYNPFNELNHLQLGKRYGFINKLENRPDFSPPLESPAINLPHPWTRSVNGICFLNTPASAGTINRFGPYEGHLVGCEYNALSLIRMSLEKVDGVYQGAAYPFSRTPLEGEPTFEGPVACAVAPEGDVYVGNIHDSGWGGGQNTGSVVRLTPSGVWPLGIGTVRALKNGLSVEFTGAIERTAASSRENYSLRSYRRVSTPAYGGPDQDERQERILAVHVATDNQRVELYLDSLRADRVYELRVGSVAGEGQKLFPSEAHYTMKRVPK